MLNKNLIFLLFIVFIFLSFVLYKINCSEMIVIFAILIMGIIMMLLENIPRIKEAIEERNLTHIIQSRKYTFLSILNFLILFIAKASNFPKLCHLIGIIFGIVTIFIFFIEYSKKAEYKGNILFNIIGTSVILFLQYLNYLHF